jgi:polysaccharide pyruvyl transferase WcaK-like protein
MRAEPKTIGLFGFFGSGNFGNDGSLEAMLLFLRRVRPDADLACICVDQEVVETAYNVRTIAVGSPKPSTPVLRALDKLLLSIPHRLHNWFRSFWHIRAFDVLIIPGTGILDDFATGPFGAPYALFRWCLAARLCGTRIAFVSIGAGPIHHPVSRWFMKSALRLAEYRSYRDANSRDFLQGIGIDAAGDPVYPDIAFSLPAPERRAPPAEPDRPLAVGLGVMAYYGWRNDVDGGAAIYDAYLRKLTRFALWLMEQGFRVHVLMGETTDARAVQDLVRAVEAERPDLAREQLVAQPSHSLHGLMRQMAETDAVVATRFHNVVCALKLGLPTLSLGYAKKNQLLLEESGLGEFSQPVESLDVDRLIGQFQTLLPRRDDHARAIGQANRLRDERLRTQEAMLTGQFLHKVEEAGQRQLALR